MPVIHFAEGVIYGYNLVCPMVFGQANYDVVYKRTSLFSSIVLYWYLRNVIIMHICVYGRYNFER